MFRSLRAAMFGKFGLNLRNDLLQRLNMQAVLIVHDHDRIAVGDMVTVARFGGKCHAPR
jgi:hypothetical protein